MRIAQDPSPRSTGLVTMVYNYRRAALVRTLEQQGMGSIDNGVHVELIPGSCSWGASPDIPPEPLVLYFDTYRDAQSTFAAADRDTSVDAAIKWADATSLPRYLSDSTHYWLFYVDDAANVSISYSKWPRSDADWLALGGSLRDSTAGGLERSRTSEASTTASQPAGSGDAVSGPLRSGASGGTGRSTTSDAGTIATSGGGMQPQSPPSPGGAIAGPLRKSGSTTAGGRTTSDATSLFRTGELRCRGGGNLEFATGGSAGSNQVLVSLVYGVSANQAGETGAGLTPGSCAWADRTGLPAERGRLTFVTAANAQLRQTQSGTTVDRSSTAAERWPDSHTIPLYMVDPSHYWRFTVVMRSSDSATNHGPWKPALAGAIAGVADAPLTRDVAERQIGDVRQTDSSATSVSIDPFAVRGIEITPSVNGVVIKFQGPTVIPLVQVSTSPPFREPSTGRWVFSPDHVALSVVRTSAGTNTYSAASSAPLQRATDYHYLINAPKPVEPGTLNRRRIEGGDRQAVGTFHTLRTNVVVHFNSVHIINDSDEGSDGELAFTFMVNGERSLDVGNGQAQISFGRKLDLADGASYTFDYVADEIPDVPDLLRLLAAGFDNDGPTGAGSYNVSWDAQPGGDGGGDWNYARAEYNLDRYPGRSFDFPFRMRTGPGSTLQFEVEGHVTVTRE